ncbi:HAD family hydrolase [Paenibacillus sp. GCM10012306]|uniref:HAD family hydrolase n=1 Tax=Paenibacillus sp. GCM10012306 TaxID=3317342 RepID=UPI00361D7881
MIRAVLFDLDGTLLDRDTSLKRFVEMQHQRLGHCLGHTSKEALINRFVELDARGYVWKDVVYRQLIDEFGIQGTTWEELLKDYVSQFHQSCVPFPNLVELLEELQRQGIELGLITNGFTALQMSNIQALGIERFFSAILVSEQEGLRKPDHRIFNLAVERLGVAPEESIYVGDHPINDVQASREAGMRAIWKKDQYWEPPVEADAIINDLSELVGVLENFIHLEPLK